MSIYATPGMPQGLVPGSGLFGQPRKPVPPINQPMTDQYNLYNTAVQQQAGDYGNIMEGYKNLLGRGPSADSMSATANLGNLATTGGLSEEDIRNIRARGISPIRSVYSSANRDVDRQKGIQGGYSPNYGAVKAKMARELSSTLSDKSTDVEGMIAEMRQRGRLQAAPQYSAAVSQNDNNARDALQGMTGLYGTTPALASLYGGQALQGAQLQNQINQAPAIMPPPRKILNGYGNNVGFGRG